MLSNNVSMKRLVVLLACLAVMMFSSTYVSANGNSGHDSTNSAGHCNHGGGQQAGGGAGTGNNTGAAH